MKIYTDKTTFTHHRGWPIEVTFAMCAREGGILFGWSFCSENDQFSKKRGRALAMTRLTTAPLMLSREEFNASTLFIEAMFRDDKTLLGFKVASKSDLVGALLRVLYVVRDSENRTRIPRKAYRELYRYGWI